MRGRSRSHLYTVSVVVSNCPRPAKYRVVAASVRNAVAKVTKHVRDDEHSCTLTVRRDEKNVDPMAFTRDCQRIEP